MKNLVDNGHAERVSQEELTINNDCVWYIPHLGIYNPKKQVKKFESPRCLRLQRTVQRRES